jgi:hypothetical protein
MEETLTAQESKGIIRKFASAVIGMAEETRQDIHYALRTMIKSPCPGWHYLDGLEWGDDYGLQFGMEAGICTCRQRKECGSW